jgi:regulator of protease activity HflC (stomatin/prohibitin superfamily)
MKISPVKNYLFFAPILISAFCTNASAEIYKQVDENGHVTYSNIKSKGATRLDIDPDANVIKNDAPRVSNKSHNSSSRSTSPSAFPKVDKETQANRDGKREEILKNELEAEKTALEQAKKAYAEGEANPEIAHQADGKTYRNMAKFNEKMKTLQAEVDAHENNIKLLQKELDTVK